MLKYEEATMEIILLEDDVVRTSPGGFGTDENPGGGGWEEGLPQQ